MKNKNTSSEERPGTDKDVFKFHKNLRKESYNKSSVSVALSPQSVTMPGIRNW